MKKLLYLLLLAPLFVLGQSNDQNWVKSTTYKQASQSAFTNPTIQQANVQVSYFDGLGRPIQQIAGKQSNTGKDIVTHIEYDAFGRQTKEYLPLASGQSNLAYIDGETANANIVSQYQSWYGDQNPYSEKQLENSPLNRVLKQAAPGNAWQMGTGKEIKFDYQTNHATEVKYFKATATWNATFQIYTTSVTQNGNYPANELYKTITFDENTPLTGKGTEEFKDKEGKVILKRTYNAGEAHDTYYIYDQYGNLSFVLSPLAEGGIGQSVLDNLGYQYQYDYRNRLVAKKLPGKQWEYIVYDQLDRPIATGPAFSPYGTGVQGWMVTQYDSFSRVTQTGWKNLSATATSRSSYQATINNGGNDFTLAANDILTKNYYDNYSFAGAPLPMPTTLTDSQLALATNVKGLPTGSWVKVLDNASSTTAEISYILYDSKYRPVRTYTKNHLGGYTQVDTNLDWTGKTMYTLTRHKRTNTANELVVKDMFTYSPQDKLLVHKQKINTLPEQLICSNTYDELGQLISKNVGGSNVTGESGLQKVDYTYNIRGWLKKINEVDGLDNDLFAFKINYEDPENSVALFNGNISETYWKTASDNLKRKYSYQYDDLNRLLEGNYSREGGNFKNSYLETMNYDKNGNIQTMYRNGDNDDVNYEFNIDNLIYTYDRENKNQLKRVFDASNSPQGFKDDSDGFDDPEDDYQYDANGNLTADANKKIQNITYNHLNLPVHIVFETGEITYLYNAAGQKLQKSVEGSDSITTEYLTGFQYHNEALNHFAHAEGYVDVVEGKFKYVFNYTDHLGNIRLSYSDANNNNTISENEILEENHYYPFGLKHSAYNTQHQGYIHQEELDKFILLQMPKFAGDGSYNYRYNSKEWQDELGLNMYDYGARNYDPAIGRWMNVDPLTEKYFYSSPYVYTANNPINLIDRDGQSWEPINKNGEVVKINDYDNIHGYRWVDYDTDKHGNKLARANTVETAYIFGIGGMTTLSSEGYIAHREWQDYEDISTGDKRADSNIASLDPRVQNQMKAVVLELRLRYGIDVRGGSQGGFRTYSEQDEIYSRGSSKAKGGQSNHNFAIAMDVAIFENGNYLSKGSEWQYKTYGNIAKKQGLMWGGDWKSFFDPAHVEFKHNKTMKQLRALPKNNRGFFIKLP